MRTLLHILQSIGRFFKVMAVIGVALLTVAIGGLIAVYLTFAGDLPNIQTVSDYRPPLVSTVYGSDGTKIGEFWSDEKRILADLKEMPPLLISAFICLYKIDGLLGDIQFPLWLVLTIISRDVILLLGSMIIYLVHGKLTIVPTRWGKATTFFQILCILGILLQINFSYVVWSIAVVLTFISGIGYIRKGIKVLNVPSDNKDRS